MIRAQKQYKKDRIALKSCFLLLAVVLVIGIGGYLYFSNWYNDAIFTPNTSSSDEVAVEVKPGDSLTNLGKTLENDGLIKSELALKVYLKLNNLSPTIKYGNYSIAKNLTVPQVIQSLQKGVFKAAVWVTFREGLRYEQIADILNNNFSVAGNGVQFNKTLFLDICQQPDNYTFESSVQAFLKTYKPKDKPLQGFIFPDTYRFDFDETSQQVVETIIKNLMTKLAANNISTTTIKSNQKDLNTFYEALTLASIIQKESGKPDDDTLISGIFHNRLEANYPLQSDATVNYALNSDSTVSVPDTKIDSPYNTYQHSGLTPTPIDNPSLKAIIASLRPAETDYFFFLYDKSGVPHFAVTYSQHQNNVYRYL